jgi:hypothetical protein
MSHRSAGTVPMLIEPTELSRHAGLNIISDIQDNLIGHRHRTKGPGFELGLLCYKHSPTPQRWIANYQIATSWNRMNWLQIGIELACIT